MEGDIITTQDVFLFDYAAGVDEHGQVPGRPAVDWACARASSSGSHDHGVHVDPAVFATGGALR